MDFLIRARMNRACDLLEATTYTVKRVADLLGYDDPFYFSRRFKSANGVAPKEYRRMKSKMGTHGRRNGVPVPLPVREFRDPVTTMTNHLRLMPVAHLGHTQRLQDQFAASR